MHLSSVLRTSAFDVSQDPFSAQDMISQFSIRLRSTPNHLRCNSSFPYADLFQAPEDRQVREASDGIFVDPRLHHTLWDCLYAPSKRIRQGYWTLYLRTAALTGR